MKRILFFDIDGVLNNTQDKFPSVPYPLSEFHPKHIKRLNKIIKYGEVTDLVCISDWRFTKGLDKILETCNMKFPFDVTSSSLQTAYYFRRPNEIKEYLKNIKEEYTFCILDDIDFYSDDEFLSSGFVHIWPMKNQFYKYNPKIGSYFGLQNRHVKSAIEKLKYNKADVV